jgi:hypothetical protein
MTFTVEPEKLSEFIRNKSKSTKSTTSGQLGLCASTQ